MSNKLMFESKLVYMCFGKLLFGKGNAYLYVTFLSHSHILPYVVRVYVCVFDIIPSKEALHSICTFHHY